MNFLSGMLRDEDGLDYKDSITIIEDSYEAKDNGLAHLCEFIEDCKNTSVAVRILCSDSAVPLHPVARGCHGHRAGTVSVFARFGALCDDLLLNLLLLLSRGMMDSDHCPAQGEEAV